MKSIFEVWRKEEDRKNSDEGRIDWRKTRDAAHRLKEELDNETSDNHTVIAQIKE